MDYTLSSDVFPLAVGKRWVYTTGVFIFTREVNMWVADKNNNKYLIKVSSGNMHGAAVVQSDVDLSLLAISSEDVNSIDEESYFDTVPKAVLLKSPIAAGASWENDMGKFKVISCNHNFKTDNKLYQGCIYLRLKDISGADNDIFIKPGIGIVYASLYIDGLGRVNLELKRYTT